MSAVDDLALLHRICHGEQQAMACIFDLHAPLVYSIAFRALGHPVDAERVLQGFS